ncbi:MAG: cell division protein FtsZ [Rhodospirillales bacterium]|nr:cell division protein FtsZ [Rhodospirillales bacterium]
MAINIAMQPTEVQKLSPRIIVAGMGGAGGNAVNNMISSGLEGCEFLVCNTDAQALENSLCDRKVQLGVGVTGGLGAGSKPEVGKAAAEESIDEVMQYFEGANMAFITAGMGGGTGTGAAPVVAKACRERGILTVGVVTKPFHFEGSHRMKSAESGIEEIQDYVDTLIVIPNQNLFRVANEKTTFADAFQMADSVLQAGVRGVTDLMVRPGLVNLDFADIRTAMLEMGKAMMGTGEAEGDKRAIEAAESAINNPLLDDVSMKGAHGVIINVTGGYDMTLFEADEACNRIRDEVDPDANIIFGATFDESLEGKMRVSIVATGIDKEAEGQKTDKTKGSGINNGVNARTKLERAMPNTGAPESQVGAPITAQRPPTFMSAQSVQAIKAPPTPAEKITAAQGAPAPRETSVDMFEQREFAENIEPGGRDDMPQNTALRGTRYEGAFIPPKPAEAVDIAPSGAAPYISSFHGEHVPQEMVSTATQAASAPGLKLNPPKQPNPEQRKRSPSLFERISGTVQEHLEGMGGRGHEASQRQRMAPTAGSGLRPMGQNQGPSQGSLNIDEPSKPGGATDENLDIPAFLRRQAN